MHQRDDMERTTDAREPRNDVNEKRIPTNGDQTTEATESGASGHPAVAREADELRPASTRPTPPGGRSDVGPHSTDVTGGAPHQEP
jgi:hypothetical protein